MLSGGAKYISPAFTCATRRRMSSTSHSFDVRYPAALCCSSTLRPGNRESSSVLAIRSAFEARKISHIQGSVWCNASQVQELKEAVARLEERVAFLEVGKHGR